MNPKQDKPPNKTDHSQPFENEGQWKSLKSREMMALIFSVRRIGFYQHFLLISSVSLLPV